MLFTAETAAEMARRSHEPWSMRFRKPAPAAELPQELPQPADDRKQRALARVLLQLDAIDAKLDATESAPGWRGRGDGPGSERDSLD